jgi:hypothetical protein
MPPLSAGWSPVGRAQKSFCNGGASRATKFHPRPAANHPSSQGERIFKQDFPHPPTDSIHPLFTHLSKDFIMNTRTLIRTTLALTLAGTALAASAMQRNVFDTDTYPAAPSAISAPGHTLEQSRQAVLAARADGSLNVFDTLSDLKLPAADGAAGVTRQQVVAETIEAVRVGAISRHEKNSFPTQGQLESIRMAGQHVPPSMMASR